MRRNLLLFIPPSFLHLDFFILVTHPHHTPANAERTTYRHRISQWTNEPGAKAVDLHRCAERNNMRIWNIRKVIWEKRRWRKKERSKIELEKIFFMCAQVQFLSGKFLIDSMGCVVHWVGVWVCLHVRCSCVCLFQFSKHRTKIYFLPSFQLLRRCGFLWLCEKLMYH